MKPQAQERRIGLARAMSKRGSCSRSQASEMIRAGRVRLNGKVRRDPETPVRLERDRITLDGQPLQALEKVYLMLNKPRTVVTTASDEAGRKTVYACLPPGLPWVAAVGRLDMASEGLLLMTNDSEWAARITAPESHLDKRYHVRVGAKAEEELLQKMMAGVESEGEWLRVKRVEVLRHGGRNCWLKVVLDEGRNRQIRRIMQALGVEVLRLVRVAIGPVELGELKKGQARRLTPKEKAALDDL
ncbi:MAG: pseudouridine synthase [Terriglobales bacterium]|jgi:23S rRNA pseudouridine2605 synthase